MGLFSGETITTVATSVTKLLDEYPNVIKNAVLQAVLTNGSIAESLISAQLNGYNLKADRYLNYGRTTFTNKLPEGNTSFLEIDIGLLANILEAIEGEPVGIFSGILDLSDPASFVFEYIQNNRQWNSLDNTVTVPTSSHPDNKYLGYEMIAASTAKIRYGYTEQVFNPTSFTYETKTIITFTESMTIPPASDGLYYHVSYSLISDTQHTQLFWIYRESLNTYPELSITGLPVSAEYYPIAPIRTNKVNLNTLPGTALNITTTKLLDYLDLDLDDITESINQSPDIKNVDDAFILFALDIHTDNKISQKYLYEFFTQIALESYITEQEFNHWKTTQESYWYGTEYDVTEYSEVPPSNKISLIDEQYNTNILYSYANRHTINGSIGAVDTLNVTTTILPQGEIKTYISGVSIWITTGSYEQSKITFTYQDTATTYIKLEIIGLIHASYNIGRGTVIKTLADTDGGFFIPLSPAILKDFSGKDESEILNEALSLLIYAYEKTHLSFFESSFFTNLVKIVITVVAIYYGAESLTSFIEGLATLTIQEAAVQIFIAGAKIYAAAYVVDALVEKLGIFGAFIVIGLSVYAFRQYQLNQGSIDGLPWAEDLLKVSTSIIDAFDTDIADELIALRQEQEQFLKDAEEQDEELQKAQDLLGDTLDMFNPLFIMSMSTYFDPTETPSDFYNKAIHITNPGVVSLDAIQYYVDGKLELPEFKPASITYT